VTETNKSYKEAFKATSLFGGVQVFNILISLVRSKITAVLIGTSGVGMLGILQVPLGMIGLITEMGLGASSVRDIAKASEGGDEIKISRTIKTLRRWVWVTGIIGVLSVIALSPLLSRWSGESSNYTWAFIFLSITLFFSALSGGQTAILRGLRKIKYTAKASLLGSFCGLIITIPLYYFYGIRGIVPSLIVSSFVGLLISWHFSRKITLVPVTLSYKDSFIQGQGMIKLGIIITLSNLIMQAVSYLIILYIKYRSGTEFVGLYNAGWAITNQYIGIIFTAMTIDYFPRLAALQSNRGKMAEAVNQQAEIALLIIAPLMLLYLSFLPIIIQLIYTKDFLPIVDFAQWMILGILLKAASWALSHIIVAKGDNRLFFFSELISNAVLLLLIMGAYSWFGLEGIGIAFVVEYVLYFSAMYFIAKKRYRISFNKEFSKVFLLQFALCLLGFLIVYTKGYPLAYVLVFLLFLFSAFYSWKKLNAKLDLREKLISILRKKDKENKNE
jgi:O-antigen/teichoic acid export membrane protein